MVLNNVCKEWRRLPDANKTWENFKLHFADVHTELQEMQSTVQELNYSAGIMNNVETEYGICKQTTDTLQALTSATADDQHDVANLSLTNVLLNDQVANLTKKSQSVTHKLTSSVKASWIYPSPSDIRSLANNQSTAGRGGGQGRGTGRGTSKKIPDKNKREPKTFDIHYFCTHGITMGHYTPAQIAQIWKMGIRGKLPSSTALVVV
eukprot:8438730-Ditylum_brightwellii.AAC.1